MTEDEISLNDKGVFNVSGKRYNIEFDNSGFIHFDKQIFELIRFIGVPFFMQYSENKPIFLNNSKSFISSADKREYSIAYYERSSRENENKNKWILETKWKLIALESYSGEKIVFFEKKDVFGKRMVLKIENDDINS